MVSRKFPYDRRVKYEVSDEKEDNAEGQEDEVDGTHYRQPKPEVIDSPLIVGEIDEKDSTLDTDTNKDTLKSCCWNNCAVSYSSSEKYPFPFRGIDLLAAVLSTVFFLFDVISDVILAEEYYRFQRWIPFVFTISLILFPHLVLNAINTSWYYNDYIEEKKNEKPTKKLVWFLRIVLSLPFMLGPVVRNVEYIHYGFKSKSGSLSESKRRYFYKMVLCENADAAMLRMIEAFLESAPQLVLQIYIIMTETNNDGPMMQIVRPAAMFGSWIGVSWSLVSYQKALRLSYNKKAKRLSFLGVIFYYIWRACEVAPRILVLSLFAAQFGYHMLVATGIHWILMSLWVGCQKQEMYEKMRDKVVHYIVIGYVLIFCFQNVQKGKTRYRAMFYYFITFAENIIILWAYFTHHKKNWVYLAVIGSIPSFMVIQIIVQLLYYKCIHPEHTKIWL
ncbi:XK-related protein 6-like [Mytilus californianus]|uniref:XK-related protein 6-like n=1 Tax=Mytilus californianus TaxID=6549 RepID=UPI0022462D1C|nr:XK-related protein 6-like [Mytilus californianus]